MAVRVFFARFVFVVAVVVSPGCPAEEASRERTASVLHVQGAVDVDRGQGFVPLAVDATLTERDRVRTGPASFALLLLDNGYVVKVDARLTLTLQDMTAFSSPPTTTPVSEQLSFLSDAERALLPPDEALAERVAGFQSRRRAGASVASVAPQREPSGTSDEGQRAPQEMPAAASAPVSRSAPAAAATLDDDIGAASDKSGEPSPVLLPDVGLGTKGSGIVEGGGIGLGGLGAPGPGGGGGARRAEGRGPTVKMTAEHRQVSGALSLEDVEREVRRHTNVVRYCYDRVLAKSPGVQGRVTLAWTIDKTGAVVAVDVVEDTTGTPELAACVRAAPWRWNFPPPKDGGVVQVRWSFVFAP